MNITYRKAIYEDIDTLIKLRLDYLTEDRGIFKTSEKEAVLVQLLKYYPAHIDRDFIALLAEMDGQVIATAFLVITERPANPAFITGKIGTLLNGFTYPEYRHKGIAKKLLEQLIDIAKAENLSYLDLSATPSGKPLYEKLGFTDQQLHYTEMKLSLM